jgi:hypothetical protein
VGVVASHERPATPALPFAEAPGASWLAASLRTKVSGLYDGFRSFHVPPACMTCNRGSARAAAEQTIIPRRPEMRAGQRRGSSRSCPAMRWLQIASATSRVVTCRGRGSVVLVLDEAVPTVLPPVEAVEVFGQPDDALPAPRVPLVGVRREQLRTARVLPRAAVVPARRRHRRRADEVVARGRAACLRHHEPPAATHRGSMGVVLLLRPDRVII